MPRSVLLKYNLTLKCSDRNALYSSIIIVRTVSMYLYCTHLLYLIFHLRKFARQCPGARCDAFKKFQQWLDITFTNGSLTEGE